MNKAITDGLLLMPPAFAAGLAVWSSEDGRPGSTTYQGSPNAALVPADQDFGGCLELVKSQSVTKLRYMGETPVLPGCYLRVTARVKAMSGAMPAVRIGAWAGGAGGLAIPGAPQFGPAVQLTSYGAVVTVTAIIGTGARTGVDMAWGRSALYGHFGLDLTGPNGGVVRIDDLAIEDVTHVFHRTMMDWVDVRDYGAIGNGVTDDTAAFVAADAAAASTGRELLVSAGTYALTADVTIAARVRFEGKVTMPASRRLALTRNFNLATYADAFGSEELGFRKAFQALLNFSDHESLDLSGRRIAVQAPIDMQAAVGNRTAYATRRVIRNGQFDVVDGPAWAPAIASSAATYSPANPLTLTGVVNLTAVEVGALVTGAGVGREVYVAGKDAATGTLTLSQPLYDAEGTQVFTFTRFRYVLDFSGFEELGKMALADIEIQCNGVASGVMLARGGLAFQMRDCFVTRPRNRGVTSIGTGCQGLLIDRCQFLSDESPVAAQARTSIALNANANDVKLRENRAVHFRHFAVLGGSGHLVVGNHWFQGDEEPAGLRLAGLVLTEPNVRTTVTGNYVDNSFIEWTNEYEADPDFASQLSFGGLTVTGNIFMAIRVAPWFGWIVIKPYGQGHFVQGLTVSHNVFKAVNGTVDRVDKVDTSLAALDHSRTRNLWFEGNAFNGVAQVTANPVIVPFTQASAQATWTVNAGPFLPFGGWARNVEAVVADGMITGASGERRADMPYVTVEQGAARQNLTLHWAAPSRGRVNVKVRADDPH